uniref:G-protein coupled receptors family 1 profile domain-containing protein n=1 Tax=Plectus sambesii TaxID=2011161 RepID=A0A914X5C7_9BILA
MDSNTTSTFSSVVTDKDLASGFLVNQSWYYMGLIWIPSVIFGLTANILVIFLGRHAQSLGNFCFAISAVAFVNTLHLLARLFILVYYYSHLWLSLKMSLIECSIVGNIFDQYVGYYIVFYIPILALYRYIFLCIKNGPLFLSKKRNVGLIIVIAAVIPTVYVFGKLYGMIVERKVEPEDMCPYKYDDNLCSFWCDRLYNYGVLASYSLSLLLCVLLCVHLYRLFRKVQGNNQGQRRTLRDEVRILIGVILHMLVPLSLTILVRGKLLLRVIGYEITVDSNIAHAVYNYNPLCDAILTILSVNPYRRAFVRLAHLSGSESANSHRPEYGANGIRMAAIHVTPVT